MAPKNDNSKAPQIKIGGSKSSTAEKAGSGSSMQSTGPVTRSQAKLNSQAPPPIALVPKTTPIFGVNLPSRPPSPVAHGGKEDAALGAKEEVAAALQKALSHPSMSQESAQKAQGSEKGYKSDDSTNSNSTSPGGTPQSRFGARHNAFDGSRGSTVMPVMTTNALALEEQVALLTKTVEGLCKTVQDRDVQMAFVMNKIESMAELSQVAPKMQDVAEASAKQQTVNNFLKIQDVAETSNKQPATQENLQISADGLIPVDQLKEFILGAVKEKYEGAPKSSLTYTKPYTQRIDQLKMPAGYQPPKFQQFDGKGNPKQHIAHFVETCNNAGTDGDLLVKQFVRTLKGNAFDWYCDLEARTIDSWEQLEQEFLNRFYSTRRTVSMIELTSTRQWKEEPVIDYINRWRNLSLNCKDRLCESSAIEMCIQGMHWGLRYILQGIKPKTFEELATRAHDMELSIAANGSHGPPVVETRKSTNKFDSRKGGKFPSKGEHKESMVVATTPVKIASNKKENEKVDSSPARGRMRPTLKERQEKEYPFPDTEVPGILDQLLALKLIDLPEIKRPEESTKVNDPNYCKYHRLVSHPTQRCFVLKDKIVRLAGEGKITLEEESEAAAAHRTSIVFGSFDPVIFCEEMHECKKSIPTTSLKIQFGSFDPVDIALPYNCASESSSASDALEPSSASAQASVTGGNDSKEEVSAHVEDEGWTLVTRRKRTKKNSCYVQLKQSGPNSNKAKKQWKKKKTIGAPAVSLEDEFSQKTRRPITLWEFLPESMRGKGNFSLHEDSCHVIGVEEVSEDVGESSSAPEHAQIESDRRCCLGNGIPCMETVRFSDEDLLLGSTPHNRPLFIKGYARERKINRMLIDGGSAVNILPLSTMKELGITPDELSQSRLMIQGFNQGGQRAIGVIRLELLIDDMASSALLHVIDAKTSYKMLLGRPWIHENGVVPSTLHQCLKYCRNGEVKKIVADEKPFAEAESHFADAKFYATSIVMRELQPLAVASIQKSSKLGDGKNPTLKNKSEEKDKNVATKAPILRYVPKSIKVEDSALEGLTLPLVNLDSVQEVAPIKGFVRPIQGQKVEHSDLPAKRTNEGFDPNAYKLL